MTAKDHRGECVAFIPKRHRNEGMIMIIFLILCMYIQFCCPLNEKL